jgi:ribosomal protein S18 acetylase RimI-like enzyme
MEIRAYRNEDLEAVVAIFRSNIPKYFTPAEEAGLYEFLDGYAEDYYVIEVSGEVVGSGGIALNELESPTVSLCWGMVHRDHLGTGLGRNLTEFRIKYSREKYGDVPLTIGTSQHTQGFYEKFGFRLTEYEKDGYGPGIDTCKMRLEF